MTIDAIQRVDSVRQVDSVTDVYAEDFILDYFDGVAAEGGFKAKTNLGLADLVTKVRNGDKVDVASFSAEVAVEDTKVAMWDLLSKAVSGLIKKLVFS